MQDIRDGLDRLFPDSADTLLALASGSTVDPDSLSKAVSDLSGGFDLSEGTTLAMDYRRGLGAPETFCDYGDPGHSLRPCLDAVVLVSRDTGSPVGVLPLPEHTDSLSPVCDLLSGSRVTVVTDRLPFDDAAVRALDRWGTDWVLTLPPFPETASAVNPKMSRLKHEGRDYETCKVRFSKHWLFRFTDVRERERQLAVLSGMQDRKAAARLERGAGITDAVSSQSFDIREIRRILDIRASTDAMVRKAWDDLPADRGEAFFGLCIAILSEMLRRSGVLFP